MRNWTSGVLWAAVVWLGLMISLPAQTLSGLEVELEEGTKIEGPPASGVRDSAELFRRDPEGLARITTRISELREQHGFELYLVVEPVLVTGNVQQLATRMQEKWVPDGNGLVLVYETDSKSLGFGQGYGQDLEKTTRVSQVPPYETMEILMAISERLDRSGTPEVFLGKVIEDLSTQYSAYFKRKETPVPEGRALRFALILTGGVAGLALVGLAAAWLLKRADSSGARAVFTLPETDAVERLGAAYGGGQVSSRRFGKGSPVARS